ncbi:hypothetical protein QDX21_09395 [Auritidibacter ignavus]|uniref:Resolvase/invertase-type recombinase catalytic domain-containing protein n=1 Tax=Auritidibacter ignavus TaxID=678932 RepID=A0AAJ6AKS1_9MICC|nr:hypothetical protein [Auritidibacter ignavus]WGH94567.1 hypothetical protein QDX21_09395 [Auritidibacter ignavus]WHS29459.1 hypothetical protein QM395_05115 [Auritidibacter ignavus]
MNATSLRIDPVRSLVDPPASGTLAVSYLRVSTREQAERGGADEGILHPRPTRGEQPQGRTARCGRR